MNKQEKNIQIYLSFLTKPNFRHFTGILSETYVLIQRFVTFYMKKYHKNKVTDLLANPYLPWAEEQMENVLDTNHSRPRKKYKEELIQMDASSYKWFDGKLAHLHLAIDDA